LRGGFSAGELGDLGDEERSLGFSLRGVAGVLSPLRNADSNRAWASLSVYSLVTFATMGRTPKRKNLKPPGRCIFCGGFGLSKEHIFAEWIQQLIPPRFTRTRHHATLGNLAFKGKLDRPGDPLSRRLRVVCKPCNEGWMSRLQSQAKPVVSSLIKGEWTTLNDVQQKLVASWMAMTTMVLEFADIATIAIPTVERERFYVVKEPAPEWYIWIAPYEGEAGSGAFWHTGFRIGDISDIGRFAGMNIQVTTFNLGRTLFHCFSNYSTLYFQPVGFSPQLGLIQVWPIQSTSVQMPVRPLNDDDAYRVATMIRSILLNLNSN
jgi:hypothetical protein